MVTVVAVKEDKVVAALNSEPTRRILSHCVVRPQSVKDLSERSAIPLPSTYRYVRSLLEDGLLYIERSALTSDGKPYDLYRSTIRSCRIEMGPDRVDVTWELDTSLDERLQYMWKSLKG